PKRPEVIFEAFALARQRDSSLRLLIVGEAAPNVDLESLAREHDVSSDAWSATGWVSDSEFDAALSMVDRVVALRYPSAGESSGAVVRIFSAGKPVAVSDYAQFADFPDEVATKIPLGADEIEALARFMTKSVEDSTTAAAQREWIASHGDPATIARDYLRIIREAAEGGGPRTAGPPNIARSTLGLMPELAVERFLATRHGRMLDVEIRLRNEGDDELRSRTWGAPAYRLIVKLYSGEQENAVEWWPLPGDLPPGRSVELSGRIRGAGDRIAFVHGWFDLPIGDERPFFESGELE
ncbi:MAG: glycosyltransferase, partial [Thermoanaerobaculia bacterium]|nr:glycosyltransferase [Thermoanaerobaculia bacterium]